MNLRFRGMIAGQPHSPTSPEIAATVMAVSLLMAEQFVRRRERVPSVRCFSLAKEASSTAPYIHNITAIFQNTGAQFYNSSYLPVGARIEHNTIYDNVTNINEPGQSDDGARSEFQGQAIYIGQNNNNPGSGDLIEEQYDHWLSAGRHPNGESAQRYQRQRHQHERELMQTISVPIFLRPILRVSNNNCHPTSGRGFHINSSHVTISDNTINVIELPQDAEYGGCEGDGTYGVQVEFDNSFLPALLPWV